MSDSFLEMNLVPNKLPEWTIEIESPFIEHIRQKAELSEEEFSSVLLTAVDILQNCPNPIGFPTTVTGLALGKVQSGKTLSFTTLIQLAIENGYCNVIVLAGTKNDLLDQSYGRLLNDLGLQDPAVNTKVFCFMNPDPNNLSQIRNIHKLKKGTLFIVLKNKTRIDSLRDLLSSPELNQGLPTLIIDDEGDEASLNTKFRKKDRSAVYRSIEELRQIFPKHAFIAYTATPQANLLQEKLSVLSPDFCTLIEPGSGYCGGSVYFGNGINDFIRDVPDSEGQSKKSGVPQSLQEALAMFLVGSAMRCILNPMSQHRMLIHSSRLKKSHKQLKEAINVLIEVWQTTLSLDKNDPSKQQLLSLFSNAYCDLIKTVSKPPKEDEVLEYIAKQGIYSIDLIMVNSLKEGENLLKYKYRFENTILIGGNKLSRGVTIKYLLVTYMTARPKKVNADTLEQRARWFGYRKSHLEYCRIYITKQLREDYSTLLVHEDDFWASLRRNRRQKIPLKDWPRLFVFSSDETLNPTRKNVADYTRFKISGWKIQRKPVLDVNKASKNIETITQFFKKYPAQSKLFCGVEHGVADSVPVDIIVEELINKVTFDKTTDFNQAFVSEYLMRLSLGNRLQSMKVLLMANGRFRERKELKTGSESINPIQGPYGQYPNDTKILDEPHLQVNLIKYLSHDKSNEVLTSAFALLLPKSEKYDLSFVVGGDDVN